MPESRSYRVSTPDQLADIPETDAAVAFIVDAYRTRLRRAGRGIEHPIEVARLLAEDGQSAKVVVAGVLHDVLEDTNTATRELEDVFGAGVARLVTALSQDQSIKNYQERKEALRQQIIDAGRDAALVSLADKTAKLRGVDSPPPKRKLHHYRETLRGIESRYGPSRMSRRLREQLERWPGP